jgi:hypothetical protein
MVKKDRIQKEHDQLDQRLESGNGTPKERSELYGARQAVA